MKHDEQTYQLIEAFVLGQLSEEEQTAFRQQMDADPALAQEVALQAEMHTQLNEEDWSLAQEKLPNQQAYTDYFASAEAKSLEQALQTAALKADETVPPTAPRKNTRRIGWLLVAAVVVLGLVVGLWPRQSNALELYQTFAQHEPIRLTNKSDESDTLTTFEQEFNKKNYAAALVAVVPDSQPDSTDNELKLAIGIAFLETGADDQARARFRQLAESTSLNREAAEWYLAMVELKAENWETLTKLLNSISQQEGHAYQLVAQKLLEELSYPK